ncbi:exonuclease SbcCD subunit D [Mogibacterium kristiansenii]|uniref:exonuclease SbcCD subunit D n=1 Tax=Mogibacterium kristiansenii TaxID=2606708 RepID=UPI00240A189F|nr:exonuclease SbcCD subunit D [Mogibacterium kristiansenii]MDD6700792.1 exonuclease SbcCD subunit D [Mogibacterium kristiansenii]
MKLMHLADLHLGKRVNGFSMMEDQEYILNRILEIMEEEQPDGLLIAGDVYDKTIPPAEAVRLMDDFLTAVAAKHVPVFLISGNHDSAERVAFGHQLMQGSGIWISPVYDGTIRHHTLEDRWGEVNIYLIPFLRPSVVRSFFPDVEIEDYTDALRTIIEDLQVDTSRRNVVLAHQFVTAAGALPETCDSEQLSVGGLDRVDGSVFSPFDYTALGHLHGPQRVGSETIRYAGSPLKYSFSELHQKKSVTVAELRAKGETEIRQIPLQPQREMIELRGTFEEILEEARKKGELQTDYYHMILTDETDVVDALSRLREYYPNIMLLDYDNRRTRSQKEVEQLDRVEERTPGELFAALYEQQNGQEMDSDRKEYLDGLIREIWEEQV